ncbi:MAG: hypothetical protein ACUVXA_03860 [Candidatus Jordarchaeum sp.]|uniref:hypothetical protein n=1 Tax=Candidatus Jordarchaeum sp. TaxID=2823881 RepID=UPI00404B74F8
MTITDEVKKLALEMNADLVGICSAEKMVEGRGNLFKIMSDARALVVIALEHFEPVLDSENLQIIQYNVHQLYHEIDRILYGLSKFLKRKGFKAVSIPAYLPVDMDEGSGLIGEVSLRHAAQCAGLGEIGLNRLLITPEYGPRVRIGALITNANLIPDEPFNEKLCMREDCAICVEDCPMGAISMKGEVEVFKCAPNILKYFIPGVVSAIDGLVEKNAGGKEIQEFARSTEFWKILQVLTSGMLYNCFKCMTSCPIGKSKK